MAANIRLTFHTAEMARAAGDGAEQQIRIVTNQILNVARRLAPVDTGALRASLTARVERRGNDVVGIVGSNLPYALFVHDGTGIYAGRGMITARNGGLLRWPRTNNSYTSTGGNRRFSGGQTSQWVFARAVRGVKGRPYLKLAVQEVMGQ